MKSKKKWLIAFAVLFLLGLGLTATWLICDWPPPRLILKYGLPPAGGPTGRRLTVEGIEFIEIESGYSRIGSHANCVRGDTLGELGESFGLPWGKKPLHAALSHRCPKWVEFPRNFFLANRELSVTEFRQAFPRWQPDYPPPDSLRDDYPVCSVAWKDAAAYCDWLSRASGFTSRLPTEDQWERACRSGSNRDMQPDAVSRLGQTAHLGLSSRPVTLAPVGSTSANIWGFHDMLGNVNEWCRELLSYCPNNDPRLGLITRPHHVYRGGCWWDALDDARLYGYRGGYRKWNPAFITGLRPLIQGPR